MTDRGFSDDYFAARANFLAAANAAGLFVESFANPRTGPGERPLYCDVARLGPADARRWLVAQSATHGAEGFVGSAAQISFLRRNLDLPAGVGVLLVHAINPFGFAWLKRVNEDNVDINRNHIDHAAGHPANALYDEAADLLVPRDWFGAGRARAEAALKAFVAKHGPNAIPLACSGQYNHPKGIFYGGIGPVWSNDVIHKIAERHLLRAELVAFVDFHTGLGPYGHGEAICYHAPGTAAFDFGRLAYGAGMTSPHVGNSASPMNKGKTGYGYEAALPAAVVSCITLEFGTFDPDSVIETIRADAWVDAYGDRNSDEARQITASLRRAFYPDEDNWRGLTALRSQEVLDQALAALADFRMPQTG